MIAGNQHLTFDSQRPIPKGSVAARLIGGSILNVGSSGFSSFMLLRAISNPSNFMLQTVFNSEVTQ